MNTISRDLLKGVSWLFFAAAGIFFFFGGRALHEFAKVDRLLAEMIGLAAAVAFAGLGALTKSLGDD